MATVKSRASALEVQLVGSGFTIGVDHSRPQSPLFFWSAPRTRTLATVKNTCSSDNGIMFYPLLFQISENAQKSRKSVIRGLLALALARVRVLGGDQKKSGVWARKWELMRLSAANTIRTAKNLKVRLFAPLHGLTNLLGFFFQNQEALGTGCSFNRNLRSEDEYESSVLRMRKRFGRRHFSNRLRI